MYIHVCTCTYVCIRVHTCAYMYIHVHTCTHMYRHVHTCTHMYIHVHTCIHMYIHVHTCTYMYIHVHTGTYMHIHVHTCTYMYIRVPRTRCVDSQSLLQNSTYYLQRIRVMHAFHECAKATSSRYVRVFEIVTLNILTISCQHNKVCFFANIPQAVNVFRECVMSRGQSFGANVWESNIRSPEKINW